MADASELAGKVVLVTGGARNIGRAISRALAAGGAAVALKRPSAAVKPPSTRAAGIGILAALAAAGIVLLCVGFVRRSPAARTTSEPVAA